MITGDYADGANVAVASASACDRIATGPELSRWTTPSLPLCAGVNVFARIVPEQKLRLGRAPLEGRGVVAMTGDGVNDAPALKTADIGVAMGVPGHGCGAGSGGMVLLDDDFSSIVAPFASGRPNLDNIQKAMAYVLAVHVPIAGLSLLPPSWDGR